MQTKTHIIHLIREDLRNKRLVFSLEEMGFDCSYYMLNLSPVIFDLAGLQQPSDALHAWYCAWTEKALAEITYQNLDAMLEKWSVKVADALLEKSRQERGDRY